MWWVGSTGSPEILAGTFAIPIDIPILGSDDLTGDGTVPAGIVDGVAAFVQDALDELTPTFPTVPYRSDDPTTMAPRAIRRACCGCGTRSSGAG